MELIKKNIHMNKLKCKSSVQLTLDDDFNVPDVKPDIDKIIKEQGIIELSDVNAVNGKLMVKGSLKFNILYISEDDNRPIHNITGELPFDENINMDEACDGDNITVKWELEDLSTSLINSRKISVKSIVSFQFTAEDVYDEETAIAVEAEDSVKYINKKLDITQIAINKKDTFRIKDEVILPSNKPNLFEVLYNEAELRNIDIRLQDEKINIKGEVLLFVLYSGEDENNPLQYMETEVPFNGNIDCAGCDEDMVDDIQIRIHNTELEIKPDSDGEERIIDLEIILDLDIKIYEEEELEIVKDVYSTAKELLPSLKDAYYENLVVKNNSKNRITDRIKVSESDPKILQICNASGSIKTDEFEVMDDGIQVEGVVEVQLLYITEDDKRPLNALKGIIPYSQFIEVKRMNKDSVYDIKPNIEQITVNMIDSDEIEIKAGINLNTIVFDKITEPIITDVKEEELDLEKLQNMPSMIGYIVKDKDSLWDIAKRYYTTVENIREMNELEQDTIKQGDKLLILKKVDII